MVLIILAVMGTIIIIGFLLSIKKSPPTHADVKAAYSQGYSDGRDNLPPADTTSGGRIILRKK